MTRQLDAFNELLSLMQLEALEDNLAGHHGDHAGGGQRERQAAVKSAFGIMGVSVLSGGLTTMSAAFLLFTCTVAFFQQFGTSPTVSLQSD